MRGMAVLAVVTVALAACGGGDDAADAPATTGAADEPSTLPATSAASAPGGTTSASAPTFTGDPGSEFCGVATEMESVPSEPDNPFDDAFFETFITTMSPLYDDLVTAAPPELAADVATEAEAFAGMTAAFAAVDYRFLDVQLSAVPQGPAIEAAKARVDAYLLQVCGITRDNDAGPPPGDGTVRDLLVDEFMSGGATEEQARCMVDVVAAAPSGSDMELGIGVMAACGFTQPLIDSGFTAEEADCVVATLAAEPDIDPADSVGLGLEVIDACQITRFFTDRGFTEEQAACMLAELAGAADLTDDDAVIEAVVQACVTTPTVPPTTA